MATYTYTTTPAEDAILQWLLLAANSKLASPIDAGKLLAGLIAADLADAGGQVNDTLMGRLTPSQRKTLGV